jgi:hypothetical protein
MCEGQQSAWGGGGGVELRRREVAADMQLAVAQARLEEALTKLERVRAHAAETQH